MPDVESWYAWRPSVRLYELLREPGYALFVFASATRLGAAHECLAVLLRSVKEVYEEAVWPCIVLDEGVQETAGVAVPVLIDFKGQFRVKLGAGHGSVLLIRPDGYVAFHREGFDFRMLSAALAPWADHRHVRSQLLAAAGGG